MKLSRSQLIDIIPIAGILFFIGLFIYSSTLYPGGSQANLSARGFDWMHNYWCNLMNEKAMNGQLNPARPFAILAMIILCVSFMIFFIHFANVCVKEKFWQKAIKYCGTFSMIFACLIFTKYHDLMTSLSSIFGIVVVLGMIRTIYRNAMSKFIVTGLFCMLLLVLNNYVYYTLHFIKYLPLLQKITFAIILSWIILLNLEIIKMRRTDYKQNLGEVKKIFLNM